MLITVVRMIIRPHISCPDRLCSRYPFTPIGSWITLSDREESLSTLHQNVLLNACPINSESCEKSNDSCNIAASHLHPAEVKALDWADHANQLLQKQWDYVLGSDIIYIEDSFEDLLGMMRQLRTSSVILSCKIRYPKDRRFIDSCGDYFDIKLLFYDQGRDIYIYDLRHK